MPKGSEELSSARREEIINACALLYETLKLMSMNHYDMEENSRMEKIIEMKVAYGKSLAEVRNCLEKFFPNMTVQDKQDFIFSFFPALNIF